MTVTTATSAPASAPVVTKTTVALDGTDIVSLVAELNAVRDAIKSAEAREKEVRSAIFDRLAGADEATVGGVAVVRAVKKSRSGVDAKLLRENYPEVAVEVTTTTEYVTLVAK